MNPWRGISGDIEAWTEDRSESSRNGRVLVELEPIKYQLENITFSKVNLRQNIVESSVKVENVTVMDSHKVSGMSSSSSSFVTLSQTCLLPRFYPCEYKLSSEEQDQDPLGPY